MFNAPRVAVAVIVLTLVAGLSYVAVPTLERAIVPAAPAPVSAEDFAGFTGTFFGIGPTVDGQRTDYDWGSTTEGDLYLGMTLKVSDERLSGKASAIHNSVRFTNGAVHGVRTFSARLTNDGGSWEGMGIAFHDPSDRLMRYEMLLSGQDGYEGLSAMLSLESDAGLSSHEATGVIFPGELPPYPVFDGAEPDFAPADRGTIDPADYGGYHGQLTLSAGGSTQGTATTGDFGSEARGAHFWDMVLESSDPRMTGVQESYYNSNNYDFGVGLVHTTNDRIVADDGWWQQTSWGYDNPETGIARYVNQIKGHGAHEGLSALEFGSQERWGGPIETIGVIFPGELPAVPDLPPAE